MKNYYAAVTIVLGTYLVGRHSLVEKAAVTGYRYQSCHLTLSVLPSNIHLRRYRLKSSA